MGILAKSPPPPIYSHTGGRDGGVRPCGKIPTFSRLVFVLKGSPVQAQDVIDDFQIQAFEAV